MMEEEIYVYCLEKDKDMVKSVLKTAENKFKKTIQEQLGKGNLYILFKKKRNGMQIDFI